MRSIYCTIPVNSFQLPVAFIKRLFCYGETQQQHSSFPTSALLLPPEGGGVFFFTHSILIRIFSLQIIFTDYLKCILCLTFVRFVLSDYRYTAVISTVANTFCDSLLDYSVNRFNYHKVLFFTSLTAAIIQLGVGIFFGLAFPVESLPYIVLHSVLILVGYIFFVLSLQYIPIALIGLIEASCLFLTFMIDAALGFVNLSVYFVFMLALFIFSVFLFTQSSLKKGKENVKKIKRIGFVYIGLSILLYLFGPYLVKIAALKGSNEISINLGYYALAVPYFAYQAIKFGKNNAPLLIKKSNIPLNIYSLCFFIGCFEAIYYVFETISFNNDAPTIVLVIAQTRAFLLFILSLLLKTDRFSLQKLIAVILGCASVTGIYFS